MADEEENESPRPTVALAIEKLNSIRALMRAEFGEVKDRIGKLEGLPERVARLEERVSDLEDDSNWRRGPLLAVAVSLVVGAVTVGTSLLIAIL